MCIINDNFPVFMELYFVFSVIGGTLIKEADSCFSIVVVFRGFGPILDMLFTGKFKVRITYSFFV